MKMGVRKPSMKKSISARTTGKATRAMKKAAIPGYGKKGTGIIKDPKKAIYNAAYNRTTFSVLPRTASGSSRKQKANRDNILYTSVNSTIVLPLRSDR